MKRYWMRRAIRLGSLSLAGLGTLWLCLSIYNWNRFDMSGLEAAADRALLRAARLKGIADPGYQLQVLESLPVNARIGTVIRLDERLAEARTLTEPPDPSREAGDVLLEVDLSGSARGPEERSGPSQLVLLDEARSDRVRAFDIPGLRAHEVGEILIRARSRNGGRLSLGWSPESATDDPWRYALDIDLEAGERFHNYSINARNVLERGIGPGEALRAIYLRLRSTGPSAVQIEHIRFVSKMGRYRERVKGVDYETVGGQMRRALFMLVPQELEFTVQVPTGGARFDVGLVQLLNTDPVEFRVRFSDGDDNDLLVRSVPASSEDWQDLSVDLTAWAGRSLTISLAALGNAENIAFWSNPVVYSLQREPFNVIVLLEDTTRADHLSLYGYDRPTTPGKHRLAQNQGVVFTHAFSQSTKTRTSVPSMMTSLLPSATGVWRFDDYLRDDYLTLAEILRYQGFATGAFIQNSNAGPAVGLHQGFSWLFNPAVCGEATEDLFGSELEAWLEAVQHRNFFLYLHVIDPHGKYDPPAPFDRWYRELGGARSSVRHDDRFDAVWEQQPSKEGRIALYDGEIEHNDLVIGEFLATLEEKGLLDHTLIVMVSDHGEYLGDVSNYHDWLLPQPARWNHYPPGLTPVVRVPLMMFYPDRFSSPGRIDTPVQVLDVMPTILELAGVESDRLLLQGDSLVGLIEGTDPDVANRVVLSEEPEMWSKVERSFHTGFNVYGSVFFGDHHFISSRRFRPERFPAVPKMRVYRYKTDPGEEQPLPTFLPDLISRARVAALLNEIQAAGIEVWRDWSMSDDLQTRNIDPDVEERLRALGYIN